MVCFLLFAFFFFKSVYSCPLSGTIDTPDLHGRPQKFQLGSCGWTTMGAVLGFFSHLFLSLFSK